MEVPVPRYVLTRPVFFIGFMGAGKTTLTRRLARLLGLASVDIDHFIERECGGSIKDLFARLGEEKFRATEASALFRAAQGECKLISCGGGLVCGSESRDLLKQGFVVYLFVSPDDSAQRISNHDTRPFFETMDSVRATNSRRVPVYESLADVTIDTTGKNPRDVAWEVKNVLLKEGVLCPAPK